MYLLSKFTHNLNKFIIYPKWRTQHKYLKSTIKASNESLKKEYKYFYSKLPKYVTIDVLVEEENLIIQLPYMLTRVIDVPKFENETKKYQYLIPATFNVKQLKYKKNDEQVFLELLQSIIRKNMTYHGLLLLIAGTPKHLINSEDAIYALRTIIRLERDQILHHNGTANVRKNYVDTTHLIGFNLLIDRLLEIGEPHAKLEALQLLTMDFRNTQGYVFRDKMLNSIVVDIFDGMFSLRLIFETIALLSKFNSIQSFREKLPLLWVGLESNEKFIDRKNILFLFECVEYLPHSRPYVIALVNKHIRDYWKTFHARHIIQMLYIMRNYRVHSLKLRAIAAKWCNANVYKMSSDSFQDVLKCFIDFKGFDQNIVYAMERYLKARSQTIDDASIFMRVSQYIMLFRLRNPTILNQLSEVVINRINYFAPYVVKDIVSPFGYLSYHPNSEILFWEILEEYVIKHFSRIRPDDLMDILMNFIYLNNFTLKFKPKIFNPDYLENFLHTSLDGIKKAQNNLYVYDMALTLENKNYHGPLLSKSERRTNVAYDTGVIHCILQMERYFNLVFDKRNMEYSRLIRLMWLPNSPLYILDIIAYPKGLVSKKSFISAAVKSDPKQFLVVLVQKPAHLTHDNVLIGQQQMRMRHLRHLGITLATIQYTRCMDFKLSHEDTLKYFEEQIFNKQYLPFKKV